MKIVRFLGYFPVSTNAIMYWPIPPIPIMIRPMASKGAHGVKALINPAANVIMTHSSKTGFRPCLSDRKPKVKDPISMPTIPKELKIPRR